MLARDVRLPLDHPNERSLHERPVPRSGGMAIMAGIFCAFAMLAIPPTLVLPSVLLAAVSFLDDVRGLPVALRFGIHCFAAVGFAAAAFPAAPIALLVLVVLSAVWMTNLYNFMDGSDGLAGGMTLFGFGFLGIAAWMAGGLTLASTCFAVAAAAAAFLVFNFHPARVFMGDTGSIPLGFLAAAIGAIGWRDGLWPMWFAPVVFSPFIADASLTIIRRLLRRERLWIAHRDHYYQRLVLMGWGHRKTAFAEYALMLACGLAALWAARQPVYWQLGAGALLAVLYCAFALAIALAWRRFSEKSH
ncbi:MAG: glycosyltransferase family 4 protein [Betaproteobacteria bacterium]|nr:glycosyltransferase family 4 protein [Betaproteobacteria bacterium]